MVGGRGAGCGHSGCDGRGLEAFDDQPDAERQLPGSHRECGERGQGEEYWPVPPHSVTNTAVMSRGAPASAAAFAPAAPPRSCRKVTSESRLTTPAKIMPASRTRAATKPSATPSFCRLTTGYSVTAVPMHARAMITSRKPPTAPQEPVFTCRQERNGRRPHNGQLTRRVPLHDVQEAASHADPRTTIRYDRARTSLDRHAT